MIFIMFVYLHGSKIVAANVKESAGTNYCHITHNDARRDIWTEVNKIRSIFQILPTNV